MSISAFCSMQADAQVKPFSLSEVRLLDSPFKQAMDMNCKYLLELDPNRMLHMFRVTAGLPSNAKPLGGWEAPNCEVRGHSMGHYLSGLALAYAATGDSRFQERSEYLVSELAKVQDAMPSQGFNSGYLCAFPESFFDRVDNAQRVWVPWYTCHKIMAGLLEVHTNCGNQQALAILKNMSKWIKLRTDRLSEEKMQTALNLEFGGMGESLADLYVITGNPDDLALARRFDKMSFTTPLANGVDRLQGLHSNTHIPQVIAAARLYDVTGEKQFRNIAEFFWKCIVPGRTFAVGGTSNYEYWRTPEGKISTELSVESQESCCTYNMLKLMRHLFKWDPDPKYADYAEQAIYNGILSTIDPKTGMTMYYVSLKPGHFKVFGTPTDSFWCCTGTGMENHSKYGGEIFYHSNDNLYLNLFIPSELDWTDKGVKLRLETCFPEDGRVKLSFSAKSPTKFVLNIRVPYWVGNGMEIKVNGKREDLDARPGSYIVLDRVWKNGDSVELSMPMKLRLEQTPDDPNVVAISYGPLVLAGKLGDQAYVNTVEQAPDQRQRHRAPGIDVSTIVTDVEVDKWLKPLQGKPMTWQTVGAGKPSEITMIPFCSLFGERYSVYWKIYSPEEYVVLEAKRQAQEKELKEMEARTVDMVQIGSSESETKHELKTEKSRTGLGEGKQWRDASAGGWFSYDMNIMPGTPQALVCTYWGSDGNGREFDILVDGVKIATQVLDRNKPGEFFNVEYVLPEELVSKKEKVTVRFEPYSGKVAGGVFGCAILKIK